MYSFPIHKKKQALFLFIFLRSTRKMIHFGQYNAMEIWWYDDMMLYKFHHTIVQLIKVSFDCKPWSCNLLVKN